MPSMGGTGGAGGTGGGTSATAGSGGEARGSGGAAGNDAPDASTTRPDAGTNTSAASGTLMGQVSINPAGYSGSGKGDVYIVVMDGNPTACALGTGGRPTLITQLVLVGVDLKGGAKAPYKTDKLPPGTYYASAFLDENATGKTNPQPDNGEFAAVDLSSFTPPKVTIVDGQQKTLDLLLNFAPPPLGGTNCAPKPK